MTTTAVSVLLYLTLGAYALSIGFLHARVGRRGGGAVPLSLGLTFRLEGIELILLAGAIAASAWGGVQIAVLLALVRIVTVTRLAAGHGVLLGMRQQRVLASRVRSVQGLCAFIASGVRAASWASRVRLFLLVLLCLAISAAAAAWS